MEFFFYFNCSNHKITLKMVNLIRNLLRFILILFSLILLALIFKYSLIFLEQHFEVFAFLQHPFRRLPADGVFDRIPIDRIAVAGIGQQRKLRQAFLQRR